MTIALTGGSLRRPTPTFRVQWNGVELPHGYVQSVSDPVTKRTNSSNIEGRHGGALGTRGTEFRQVNIVVRILSRLDTNNSGRSHLDDVLEQVRENLRVVDTDAAGQLMIGDSDRYLDAVLSNWDHSMALDSHNGMNLSLSFTAQPYFIGSTATTATREGASVARITGTANGTVSYIAGRYNQALLCNSTGEYVSYPPTDSIDMTAGTMAMWVKPQYASTGIPATSYVTVVTADSPAHWWRMGEASGTVIDGPGTADGTIVGAGSVTRNVTGLIVGADDDGAIDFGGSAGDAAVSVLSGTTLGTTYSLEAWVRPDSLASDMVILTRLNSINCRLFVANTTGLLSFIYGGVGDVIVSPTGLSVGNTYHIVATHDGTTARLYVNSELTISDATGAPDSVTAGQWVIGASTTTPTVEFNGVIDEVALYDGVLLASRIEAHYDAGVAADANQDGPVMRIADASNNIAIGWDGGTNRLRAHGTSDTPVFAQSPALTFSSGSNIFLALRWTNLGTTIFVGSASGTLLTSSSTNVVSGTILTPTSLRVGGNGTSYSHAGVSDIVIFGSALTDNQIEYIFSGSEAYDPMDTNLPTTMLLDLPLNSTTIANSSSNSVYMDVPSTRATYPMIALDGTGAITISHSDKLLEYEAAPTPSVLVDCATLTVVDSAGSNKVTNIGSPNFGFVVTDAPSREAFLTTAVSGSVDVTVGISSRYER